MSEYTEGPWIEHTTGKMPVPGDTMVRWRVRTVGSNEDEWECEAPYKAKELEWGAYSVISRYRVHADESGWIRHVPGNCPVDESALVEVRLRNGATHEDSAIEFYWGNVGEKTIESYHVKGGHAARNAPKASAPDTTLEALISAAIAYKDATTHQQKALERLNEAVKAFKGK